MKQRETKGNGRKGGTKRKGARSMKQEAWRKRYI